MNLFVAILFGVNDCSVWVLGLVVTHGSSTVHCCRNIFGGGVTVVTTTLN